MQSRSFETKKHESVLLLGSIEALRLRSDATVVDATIGGAGHFSRMYEQLGAEGMLIGIDADADAIERAKKAIAESALGPRVHLVEGNFRNLSAILDDAGVEGIDGILFDLGWSAFHLSRGRGFSFQTDEPLVMTYGNPETGMTARDILNTAREEELSDILFTLGEERFARAIAHAIVEARTHTPIETTAQLVSIVEAATPTWYQHRKINPATKTFQALRIAVNDELGAVREGMEAALSRMNSRGRIAVISFHSIEDRIVKNIFRDAAHAGRGTLITKKPIVPSVRECAKNPRARSAKLRVFEAA